MSDVTKVKSTKAKLGAARAERASKQQSKKEASVQSQIKSSPALTSFDFLEGEFKRSRNTRMTVLTSMGAVVILVAAVLGYGFVAKIQNNTETTKLQAMNSTHLKTTAELKRIDSIKVGSQLYGESDLSAHLLEKQKEGFFATSGDVNVGKVLIDLKALTSSDVSITSLVIGANTAASVSPSTSAASGASLPGAPPTPKKLSLTSQASALKATLIVTVTSCDAASLWVNKITAATLFSKTPLPTTSRSGCSVGASSSAATTITTVGVLSARYASPKLSAVTNLGK